MGGDEVFEEEVFGCSLRNCDQARDDGRDFDSGQFGIAFIFEFDGEVEAEVTDEWEGGVGVEH